MTRSRDIADQQDNLGGAVAPFVAGKNFAVNGGMDVWQRGTSFANLGTYAYTADRWEGFISSSYTVSQQNVSSLLPNFTYALRAQRNSGSTATNYFNTEQGLETVNIIPLRGNIATVSFWARCGANFSATSSQLGVALFTGTGTERVRNVTAFTNETTPINANATLTTTYQKFTFTSTAVPTNSTQMALTLSAYPTGTAGANDWYEVTGIQLEIGSVATPFSRAGGSYGGELALCQRYYYRNASGSSYGLQGSGYAYQTDRAVFTIVFPVTMRTAPGSAEYSGLAIDQYGVTGFSFTGLSVTSSVKTQNTCIVETSGSTGLTQYRPYALMGANNTASYLGFSAEL